MTNFVDIYQRLGEAGAARLVSAPDRLAEGVSRLLSPEEAAAMAANAWEVISSGADVTDRAVALVMDTLDEVEVAALRATAEAV